MQFPKKIYVSSLFQWDVLSCSNENSNPVRFSVQDSSAIPPWKYLKVASWTFKLLPLVSMANADQPSCLRPSRMRRRILLVPVMWCWWHKWTRLLRMRVAGVAASCSNKFLETHNSNNCLGVGFQALWNIDARKGWLVASMNCGSLRQAVLNRTRLARWACQGDVRPPGPQAQKSMKLAAMNSLTPPIAAMTAQAPLSRPLQSPVVVGHVRLMAPSGWR